MSRLGRNRSLIVALLLMGLISVVALLTTTAAQPFALASEKADGLAILVRWLDRMGYQVRETGRDGFGVAAEADLLIVHMPWRSFSDEEISVLDDLLARGGTLVLVGVDANKDPKLAAYFDINTPREARSSNQITQILPLLPDASALFVTNYRSHALNLFYENDILPILSNDIYEPITAVVNVGPGVLWLLDDGMTLTNAQLKPPTTEAIGHPARYLVPALLRAVPDGGKIVIDTYHRQLPWTAQADPSPQIATLQDWLYTNPVGWGILFGLGMLALYLLLQGRRLGPPVPVLMETRRREAAEYVRAMAGLKRRGHYRTSVAWRYGHQLKIALGRPLHIPPDLDPAPFMAQLRQADHRLAPKQLAEAEQILTGLAAEPDEAQLVSLVAQAQTLMGTPNRPSS